MKLEIAISLDNAAFEDAPEAEIAACLAQVIGKATTQPDSGKLRDSNGNMVGSWKVYTEDPIESGNE